MISTRTGCVSPFSTRAGSEIRLCVDIVLMFNHRGGGGANSQFDIIIERGER
jgi:hypothetical protein